ncbi:989_t:CDS:2, partial [Cetraspora pellucida]
MNVKSLTEDSSSSGSLEHTTSNNSKENRTYLMKEKNPYLEEVNNTVLLTNQDDKGSICDKAEFETTTNDEVNNETTIHIKENIKITTHKGLMNEQNNLILKEYPIPSFSRF